MSKKEESIEKHYNNPVMKNVPSPAKVPQLSDDATAGPVRPVTDLAAVPVSSSQSVVVHLRVPGSALDFAFALSLAGATLLSGEIELAVESCLRPGSEGDEGREN